MSTFNEQKLEELFGRPSGRIDPLWTKEEIEEDEKENKKLKRVQMANASTMKRAMRPKKTGGGGAMNMFGLFNAGQKSLQDADDRRWDQINKFGSHQMTLRRLATEAQKERARQEGATLRARIDADKERDLVRMKADADRSLLMDQLVADGKLTKHKIKKVGPQGRSTHFEYRDARTGRQIQ